MIIRLIFHCHSKRNMCPICTVLSLYLIQIKTMLPGEHQQVLSNLQSHFDEFLEDSDESEVFTVADCSQLEREVAACKEYYQELLRSAERGKALLPLPVPHNYELLMHIEHNAARETHGSLSLLSPKSIPFRIM